MCLIRVRAAVYYVLFPIGVICECWIFLRITREVSTFDAAVMLCAVMIHLFGICRYKLLKSPSFNCGVFSCWSGCCCSQDRKCIYQSDSTCLDSCCGWVSSVLIFLSISSLASFRDRRVYN